MISFVVHWIKKNKQTKKHIGPRSRDLYNLVIWNTYVLAAALYEHEYKRIDNENWMDRQQDISAFCMDTWKICFDWNATLFERFYLFIYLSVSCSTAALLLGYFTRKLMKLPPYYAEEAWERQRLQVFQPFILVSTG